MQNPFSWDYLNAPLWRMSTWGPLSIAFALVCGIGFIVSLLIYYDVGGISRRAPNRIVAAALQRATAISSILFGLGLFFFSFRALHVSAFGLYKRYWLYLVLIGLLVEGGYYLWWARSVYPVKLRELEAQKLRQRYLAPAVTGGSSGRRRRKRKKRA